jgi:Flp pilus assembly CpaF family ATPase
MDTLEDVIRSVTADVTDRLVQVRVDGRGLSGGAVPGASTAEVIDSILRDELDRVAARRLGAAQPLLGNDDEERVRSSVRAAVLGMGRIQPLLDDPEVGDIHIRGCDSVWLKLRDGRRVRSGPVASGDDELIELVRVAAARLGHEERPFDAAHPELNLQLPDGSRLFAVMAVSQRPSVIIRRHQFSLSCLDELVERRMLDTRLREFLGAAVRARRNMIIAGGTGSGKTTLLRALLNEVPAHERIVTIEDAFELGIDRFADRHPDHDSLQARPPNGEGHGEITMADLTRMALRMDPDRVVLGEVRGGEAFPMLLAMSQGNNGSMCTMHADSSGSVFTKLAAYVALAETGLPIETVNLLMAGAVHFVIHLRLIDGVRRVASIREVVDADGARIISNEVYALDAVGSVAPAYQLRDSTRELLENHGFDDALLSAGEVGTRW